MAMSNKDILKAMKLLVALMELHDADPTLIKPFSNAIYRLDQLSEELPTQDVVGIQRAGFSKSMAAKIFDLANSQTFEEHKSYIEKTPSGLLDVLEIKGIGAKKVRTLWLELQIEDLEALRDACEAGMVAKLKGFGEKTQKLILENISFMNVSSGKFLLSEAEPYQAFLEAYLQTAVGVERWSASGQWRRRTETIDTLSFVVQVVSRADFFASLNSSERFSCTHQSPFIWEGHFDETPALKIIIHCADSESFEKTLFLETATEAHLFLNAAAEGSSKNLYQIVKAKKTWESEEAIYEAANWPHFLPEQREGLFEEDWIKAGSVPVALQKEDIKGVLHLHSTYSDGADSLEQMALHAKNMGFEYIGITDHSQSSFYANGMSEGRVRQQQQEIDLLNAKLAPFRIFKGIEVDILNDGSLDYDMTILNTFDFTIASIHQNLRMPIEKATERLLGAIENPHTTIMGHLTGRLLLRREGYPVDYKRIIDACAAHQVGIEINANAYRLDLDWRWLPYAIKKGIWISINPDAHTTKGYQDIKYGVAMARKAALQSQQTLNALSCTDIARYFETRKSPLVNL